MRLVHRGPLETEWLCGPITSPRSGVTVIPGSTFGTNGHLRICFATEIAHL